MLSQEPRLAQREARVRHAMDRVRSYLKVGKIGEVRKVLAAKSISESTMRIWLKDPKKALTAYRWTEFVAAIDELPDLERAKRNEAYEFALKELNVSRDAQHELANYNGNYRVFHDFHGIKLYNLAIRIEHTPFVVTFAFKYSNKEGHRGFCDGLVVSRQGRLVCAGLSPTTMFQGVFQCVAYPERELIRGLALIEDLETHEVCYSSIVITRGVKALSEAERIVRKSGRTL